MCCSLIAHLRCSTILEAHLVCGLFQQFFCQRGTTRIGPEYSIFIQYDSELDRFRRTQPPSCDGY